MRGESVSPSPPRNGYVVPLPRVTDALGETMRRVFAVTRMPEDFAPLLRRLDTLH